MFFTSHRLAVRISLPFYDFERKKLGFAASLLV